MAESCDDGSMRLTYVFFGTPAKRLLTSSQLPPSERVSHTRPSSVPAQRIPGRMGDSASDTIVLYVSAPVTSGVMPPVVFVETRMRIVSRVVRSGEIGYRLSPCCVLLSTRLAPTYSVAAACGEMKYGVFQLKRRSRSVESCFWRARSSATRFRATGDSGCAVSPRSTMIESSMSM